MTNNNLNTNDSEIGVVVNKDAPVRVSENKNCTTESTEIHYIDIESHLRFIDRVFSVKQHHDRNAHLESR